MKDNDKAGLLQAMQNKAQTTKRKKNRMQRTAGKLDCLGVRLLAWFPHEKMTPYFFLVRLLQSKDCLFSCLICLRVFQEVSAWGRCLEICVVQGLVCQIFFSDGGCHEKQQ